MSFFQSNLFVNYDDHLLFLQCDKFSSLPIILVSMSAGSSVRNINGSDSLTWSESYLHCGCFILCHDNFKTNLCFWNAVPGQSFKFVSIVSSCFSCNKEYEFYCDGGFWKVVAEISVVNVNSCCLFNLTSPNIEWKCSSFSFRYL